MFNLVKPGQLLNEYDVATELKVSVGTIRRWRLLRQGPPWAKIGASVRYRPEDVAEWVKSQLHAVNG